jgi:excinuclease ABC subunit B
VLLYADTITPSMQRAMDETERRRKKQMAYNAEHGITPSTIIKEVSALLGISHRAEAGETAYSEQEKAARIELLTEQMQQAARELEFEQAAKLRDEIRKLRGETVTASKKIRPGMVGSAKKSRGRARK